MLKVFKVQTALLPRYIKSKFVGNVVLAGNYHSEPSIVPCSIIIPPPNFQKKSEILKISDNNPTPTF